MAPKRQRDDINAAALKISRQKARHTKNGEPRKKPVGDGDGSTSTPTPSSPSPGDVAALEAAILSLLRSREPGSNCCPSEVPRRLLGEKGDWRRRMPAVREAAARLVERGELEITQKGVAVSDPRNFKGPIRLRLARSF